MKKKILSVFLLLALLLGIASSGDRVSPVFADKYTPDIVGWGMSGHGQTSVPAGLSDVTAFSGGGYHSLALKSDGTVVAWGCGGGKDVGQCNVPADLTGVTAISAGYYHNLALKSDGTVVAWGENTYGQSTIPAGLSDVVAISAGGYHNLAQKSDGTIVIWGSQAYIPPGLSGVTAISAGGGHNLALKNDGTVVSWGCGPSHEYGQCNVPADLTGVTAISAGWYHSMALKNDGTVVDWGNNISGPVTVPAGLNNVIAISAGGGHALALKNDGTVVAWGDNSFQQARVPAGLSGVTAISAGFIHNLAFGLWNNTPVAQNQSVRTNQGAAVDITLSATDADNDSLTFSIAAGPLHGTLSGTAPVLTYTPAANYVGRDNFTYTASDGDLDSSVARVDIAVVPDSAPPQVVVPVPGPDLDIYQATVNDGAGGQTDPHLSGDWVSYTDNSVYGVRFQNLDLGSTSDRLIPVPGGHFDTLSDINGNNIVFLRVESGSQGIYLSQIDPFGDPGPAVELSPSTGALRRRSTIGGDTIAYEDRGYDPSYSAQPEISLSDATNPAAPAYRLTNDAFSDQWPAVSPDGNAVVWVKCESSNVCDVWRAERTESVWGAPELVDIAERTDSLPDTNGPVTVYGSTTPDDDTDIRWSVKDSSGAYIEYMLALPGIQRNPNIAGDLIVFESNAAPGTQFDIYLYDLATNRLYPLTDTPVSETLSDVSINAFGVIRVAWAQPKQVSPYDMDIYALSAVLPPLDDNTASTANPGGPYLGAVNTAIQFDSSLSSDPENDPLTFAWTFGDGATGTDAAPTHSYTAAGIYDVCLTVNDGTLDSAQACTLAVVYDPSAGFVTGGGWIDSPAGAYKADESLSGKATFGFVSKYQKGASVPAGTTAFEFDLAGMAFSSQSYEWLVVNQAGTNAQFKGSGLINGALDPNGNAYKFMLWAGDGSPDTFRIRIWWEDTAGEHDVYDNGVDQPIGAGNIVVHTGK